MLEISSLPENPTQNPHLTEQQGHASSAAAAAPQLSGEDAGDRNSAANRWPREETMALLRIRSEMDLVFRDTSPKAPLWEQVSRKLAELGYHRNAKKCREKFENIYKYHRRTKEGRFGKANNSGKTYRFFEQLEALETNPVHVPVPPSSSDATQQEMWVNSTTKTTHVASDNNNNNNNNQVDVIQDAVPCSFRFPGGNVMEHSSSATCSSGEGVEGKEKKKRKLTQFFEGLMREVIVRQETLQRKFMEVLDKCERDRVAREEAWKVEELARVQREREALAQERAVSAAKDEAVLALLRKITENSGAGMVQLPEKFHVIPDENGNGNVNVNGEGEKLQQEGGNVNVGVNVGSFIHMSSSRWPKEEVEALIRLRTQLDVQSNSQGNSNNGSNSKGPLWEEISSAMKSIGYDRSAKRCKEKWENINKYFKRMKEKNKRKPTDSKTCPYYHHLEALYSKKPKKVDDSGGSGSELKPEELLMHIMESQGERQQLESSSEDCDRENMEQNQGDNDEDQDGYQMVDNNSPSIGIMS